MDGTVEYIIISLQRIKTPPPMSILDYVVAPERVTNENTNTDIR